MRALLKLTLVLVLLGISACVGLAWFGTSDTPLVERPNGLSHEDIARAKTILKTHDPRSLPPGTRRTLEVSGKDLNLAANYLLQKVAVGGARLELADDQLALQATLRLPLLPAPRYLNLRAMLEARGTGPVVTRLHVGRVPVPAPLARALVTRALNHWFGGTEWQGAAGLLQDLQILPDRLRLTYRWHPGLLDQARDTLLTGHDREALRFYHDRLLELQGQGIGRRGALTELLEPMFASALVRSRERDPVAENIALLTVLGTWSSRRDTRQLIPGSTQRPSGYRLRLQGRIDFGQHFLTSAALAARGDTTLSDAVGVFKEIADSDRGSGFSFADITADRAGTRFGELASRSADRAARLQQQLAAGVHEDDIMPDAGNLPENMDAATFKARYGHVGSDAYRRVMHDIEQRIDACRLYRD